jgi:hypothetical protein
MKLGESSLVLSQFETFYSTMYAVKVAPKDNSAYRTLSRYSGLRRRGVRIIL